MAHEWFIIHTLSGQEQKVLDSINKRIDVEEMGEHIKDVFVAKEKVVDVRGGEKKVSTKNFSRDMCSSTSSFEMKIARPSLSR